MPGSNEPRFAMLLRAFQIIISPRNLTLAHVTSLLVGHQMMMQSNVSSLLPMPLRAGFADVSSGPTQSLFLAFVSGKSQAINSQRDRNHFNRYTLPISRSTN